MAQFASVWAVKDHRSLNPGDVIDVRLKNGGSKPVTIAAFLYEREARDGSVSRYYLPAKQED